MFDPRWVNPADRDKGQSTVIEVRRAESGVRGIVGRLLHRVKSSPHPAQLPEPPPDESVKYTVLQGLWVQGASGVPHVEYRARSPPLFENTLGIGSDRYDLFDVFLHGPRDR